MTVSDSGRRGRRAQAASVSVAVTVTRATGTQATTAQVRVSGAVA